MRSTRFFLPLLGLGILGLSSTAPAHAQLFSLGTAQNFAVLGGSTVINTGSSVVNGDLGVSPGTDVTGFPPGTLNGTLHLNDATALQAQADATTSYNALSAMTTTQDLSGQDLGGRTLTPGVYHFSSAAQLTGTLTLNALGSADALFVFQIGSALTTASNAGVNLINGGNEGNIFFQVGSSATLGTGTAFQGNILADQSITLDNGANMMSGRALAINAAVTLDTNGISISGTTPVQGAAGTFGTGTGLITGADSAPEPGSIALLALGMTSGLPVVGRIARRRRKAA